MLNRLVIAAISIFSLTACDLVNKDALQCVEVCNKVDQCEANPPALNFGNIEASSGVGAVDCAANCAQDERDFYGYSDCQIDCIHNTGCGNINDCWVVSSDTYAEFCLADREVPEVAAEAPAEEPDNGTASGSEKADEMLDNPANSIAIEESGTTSYGGDNPPDITGKYVVSGEITDAENARPIGSAIQTGICFSGQDNSKDSGPEVTYCEDGIPGSPSAPVTGDGDNFTIFLEYPGAATLLFSGTVDGDGKIVEAETLVVYLHGVDIWEYSVTGWTYDGDCTGCSR